MWKKFCFNKRLNNTIMLHYYLNKKMFCLKCKKQTKTLNLYTRISKNNKYMLVGKCKYCNKIKTKFIKQNVFSKI